MADHVNELEARVSALDARVDGEVAAVQQHFDAQQQFITFSLDRLATRLRTERREDLNSGLSEIKLDVRRVDGRLEALEGQVDAHHAATQKVLREILSGLPAVEAKADAHHAATQKALQEILSRLPKTE